MRNVIKSKKRGKNQPSENKKQKNDRMNENENWNWRDEKRSGDKKAPRLSEFNELKWMKKET